MSNVDTQDLDQNSHLNMSDEDFAKAPVPVLPEIVVVEAVDTPATETTVIPANTQNADADDEDEEDKDPTGEKVPGAAEGADESGVKPVAAEKGVVVDPSQAVDKPADKAGESVVVAPIPVDYKAEYERLLKPFKANGRDVSVTSVDDALSLMQMGANYNKKMAGLKPSMKILKLLENNGLLDENKLSYLIDLDKKDPLAINKLVQDSGLNPMDLDAAKAGEYRPKTRTVDEREMELDTVLDDIQSTPTYTRTLEVVSKKWDGPSKQIVAAQPQLLKVINDHMSSGIYDLITAEIESQRMFGRLDGLSDIDAYRKVGDAIQARGGFNDLGSSQSKSAAAPVVVQPKPKVEDEALNNKRRAASSTPAAVVTAPGTFNPLGLSDEEFAKQAAPRFR